MGQPVLRTGQPGQPQMDVAVDGGELPSGGVPDTEVSNWLANGPEDALVERLCDHLSTDPADVPVISQEPA
jgi:hypothetical protein